MKLADHPTVKAFYEKAAQAPAPSAPTTLDADWLRQLCRDAGADDAGLVEISRRPCGVTRNGCVRASSPGTTSNQPWACNGLTLRLRVDGSMCRISQTCPGRARPSLAATSKMFNWLTLSRSGRRTSS